MDSGNDKNLATSFQFKQFDVVPEATDHHYLQSHKSAKDKKCFKDGNTSVYAKIMKEWKILQTNLPESIYVQVYETRIDLLRAVIIGSAGTPYHDGLFFFDILLPSDYPIQPPKVHYHSHSYRLNPNLYADGTVCLSLINTWGGSKAEKWTQQSTILQILVSIQGLVLNERPFFNEPAYEGGKKSKSSWMSKSIDYNQEVFILSCKTMLQIMQKPPQNFESFVAQHFRVRKASILAAIEDYKEGRVPVGESQMNAASSSSSSVKVSQKFKANLIKNHSDLKIALAAVISEPSMENQEKLKNVNKHTNGILKKLISFAKWMEKKIGGIE
ncbi:hypothetical protein Pfo_015870 [Paulownia fortunei]|nr:hypothetical protein Pfo_015870 [Paulownia fortunei]